MGIRNHHSAKPGRRHWRVLVAGACVVLAGVWASQAASLRYLRIATGDAAGTYFAVGEGLAALLTRPPGLPPCSDNAPCGIDNVIAVAQLSSGAIANLQALQQGRIDSGIAQADLVTQAYQGVGPFEGGGALSRLRVLSNLYRDAVHLVAARTSGIRTMADLAGKRLSIGPPGSGAHAVGAALLRAYKVATPARILPPDQAADALLAGELDAFFYVAGPGAELVRDLADRGAIVLIPIDGGPAEKLRLDRGEYVGGIIPADSYQGVGEVKTMTVAAQWVVHEGLSEELAYEMTRSLWEARNATARARAHERLADLQIVNSVKGVTIPLHPGAERFYFDAGVLERL